MFRQRERLLWDTGISEIRQSCRRRSTSDQGLWFLGKVNGDFKSPGFYLRTKRILKFWGGWEIQNFVNFVSWARTKKNGASPRCRECFEGTLNRWTSGAQILEIFAEWWKKSSLCLVFLSWTELRGQLARKIGSVSSRGFSECIVEDCARFYLWVMLSDVTSAKVRPLVPLRWTIPRNLPHRGLIPPRDYARWNDVVEGSQKEPTAQNGCISLSRFIYNNRSDRASRERSR